MSVLALFSRVYSTYDEYLRHPRFRAIRRKALERDGYTCTICERNAANQVHHLRYPKWGTFDTPRNLISVCYECHCVIEGKVK
jgi:5-methylcytosine-specific restriction endonuclease McrA